MADFLGIPRGRWPIAVALVLLLAFTLSWLQGRFDATDASGSSANNILVGGDGNDTLTDGSGRDILIGGKGNDTLNANGSLSGADVVIGGYTDYDRTFSWADVGVH